MKYLHPFRRLRTANAAEMRLSVAISTANIADVPDGEWALIAPYGVFPSPDGSYVQQFDRAQADKVVATWNSITGTAARAFKNLWHRQGLKYSAPVWDGHPETDRQRWPVEKLLAEITDLRTGNEGLEGRITWNAKNAGARSRGPLYPSPLWWHCPPQGEPPTVYPELLESVGLVATPNISSVPAWTQNATLAGNPQAELEPTETNQHMTPQEIMALRKALGLAESSDFSAILAGATTANAAVSALAARDSALQTANSAKADLETKLTTADCQIATLTTERDTIKAERDTHKTANAALTTDRDALVAGVLDLAEKKGALTPAERAGFKTRITTANTAPDALKELQTRKAMNVTSVEISGNRIDLTTANARANAVTSAVQKRMKEDEIDYSEAFTRVKADPNFKALFDAMKQPTIAAA